MQSRLRYRVLREFELPIAKVRDRYWFTLDWKTALPGRRTPNRYSFYENEEIEVDTESVEPLIHRRLNRRTLSIDRPQMAHFLTLVGPFLCPMT